ncbi:MAG: serine hydrolase [Pseudomonadota bacterium]
MRILKNQWVSIVLGMGAIAVPAVAEVYQADYENGARLYRSEYRHTLSPRKTDPSTLRAGATSTGRTASRPPFNNDDLGDFVFLPPAAKADSDGDGVPDDQDAFPFDPNEVSDSDNDGIGNNADTDDDNDGTPDVDDDFPINPARTMPIQPLFPETNGVTDFPDYAVGDQFEWIMAQLSLPSTSLADIEARFVPGFDFASLQSFFDTLRTSFPNARVIEAINVTARQAQVVIGDPTNPGSTAGFVDLRIRFSDNKITYFFVQNFPQNPSSTLLSDQNLTLAQAGAQAESLGEELSLLVGRIDNNVCTPIYGINRDTPRATGSIFKAWVLGAAAEAVKDGTITPDQNMVFDANEIVPFAGPLNDEPLGALFSVSDMANMMMGTSDNTATDHLHEFVGRTAAQASLSTFNHATPSVMSPFLSINETFHLYWTVPEVDALAYANGTESAQVDYMNNVLVPLGPVTAFPQANGSVLVDGTWQASPMDVCRVIAGMRQYNDKSDEFRMVDLAYGANAGAWQARRNWERVWFKGGSLGDPQGLVVLTLGWLLESDDRGAYVVVGMLNTQSSNPGRIDSGAFGSTMSRIIDIVTEEF